MNKILSVLLIIVFCVSQFLQNSEYYGIIGSILGALIGYSCVYVWRFNYLKECLLDKSIFMEKESKELYDINIPDGEELRDAKDYIRNSAMQMIIRHGGHDGEHHKEWCLDQVFRILAGNQYQDIVDDQKKAGYDWKEGIAP